METYEVILQPVLTEQSSLDQARGVYTFIVNKKANKIEVKKAVKAIYGKEVDKVTTSIRPSKKRLIGRGRVITKRPVQKIAKVTLKNNETIDPNDIKGSKTTKKTTSTKKK